MSEDIFEVPKAEAETRVAVMLMDLAIIAKKGQMVDMTQFDAALSHKGLRLEKYYSTVLHPGEAVWVPWGYLPVVIGTDEINYYTVYPWMATELKNTLKERHSDVLDMIVSGIKKAAKSWSKDPDKSQKEGLIAFGMACAPDALMQYAVASVLPHMCSCS